MMKTITTSECKDCKYGSIDKSDKKYVKVICSLKDKSYCYGQRIECDKKEKL